MINQGMVSIVTPMYNAEKFVRQTLDSVLEQTYSNWEMLVVDDGSKDNSQAIVTEYSQRDKRIKLIKQANGGSAAARNHALRQIQGQYVCFLDSDDIWDKTFLEKQLQFMQQHRAVLVYASYRRINENNVEILKPFIVPPKVDYRGLLKTCSISCLTALYDRSIVGEVYFNEALKSLRDDFVFWLTILKRIDYAYGNPEVLAAYRVFSTSTTGNKKKVIKPQFRVYHKVEKLGLVRSMYYFIHWAVNGFFKYR